MKLRVQRGIPPQQQRRRHHRQQQRQRQRQRGLLLSSSLIRSKTPKFLRIKNKQLSSILTIIITLIVFVFFINIQNVFMDETTTTTTANSSSYNNNFYYYSIIKNDFLESSSSRGNSHHNNRKKRNATSTSTTTTATSTAMMENWNYQKLTTTSTNIPDTGNNIDIQSVRGIVVPNNTNNNTNNNHIMITNLSGVCPKSMLPSSDIIDSVLYLSPPTQSQSQSLSSFNKYSNNVGLITLVLNRKQKELSNLIQSVRRRGSWLGPIIVVTDIEKVVSSLSKYNTTSNYNVFTIFVNNTDTQYYQNQKLIKKRFMKFKRFKTQFFDILPKQLSHLQYLLYVDADILIGNSIIDFLDRVLPMFDINNNNNNNNNNSITTTTNNKVNVVNWLLFKEQGYHPAEQNNQQQQQQQQAEGGERPRIFFHTGVMLIHRNLSKECLQRWKYQFDTDKFGSDQAALKDMLYNNNNNNNTSSSLSSEESQQQKKCYIEELPPEDLMMPNQVKIQDGKVATFIHLTHVRIKRVYKYLHNYKKCSLLLDDIDTIGWK